VFPMSQGAAMLGATRSFIVPLEEVCVIGKGNEFGFNHKIMIKVKKSLPSIMVTRNLWSTRVWVRDWLC
jgi:hypothetical protein